MPFQLQDYMTENQDPEFCLPVLKHASNGWCLIFGLPRQSLLQVCEVVFLELCLFRLRVQLKQMRASQSAVSASTARDCRSSALGVMEPRAAAAENTKPPVTLCKELILPQRQKKKKKEEEEDGEGTGGSALIVTSTRRLPSCQCHACTTASQLVPSRACRRQSLMIAKTITACVGGGKPDGFMYIELERQVACPAVSLVMSG